MAKKEKRFVIHGESIGLNSAKIILDTKTGVHYLFFNDGSAGGITPLLDSDGKPVILKPSKGESSDGS